MSHLAPGHLRSRRGPRGGWSAAALALVAVAACLVIWAQDTTAPAAAPTFEPRAAAGDPTPAATSGEPWGRGEPATERPPALPQRLSIPAIGVATDLVRLGLNPDRTVEVPQVAAEAGWFDQGPVPGEVGSSVILGHVDSREGPAVFHRLGELTPGDRIAVHLSGGVVVTFSVVRVATYPNDDFPAKRVYAGTPRRPTLTLVTCGGDYDADRGGYQSNVVVFTERVPSPMP